MSDPLSSLADNLRIDKDRCIACGICVDRCILDNIRLQQAPCAANCPLGINAQGYVQLIARGDFERALDVVYEQLPFPGIVGRICSMPCERHCQRREVDGEAVAIRSLKRFLYSQLESRSPDLTVPGREPGRVAVIGTGPAGMLCAWDLRKAGCHVAMYDSNSAPGGMLWQTIPEFRLPKRVVRHEFSYLSAMGVDVHLATPIGSAVSFDHLLQEFDAVFVATGAPQSTRLDIEGETGPRVHHALSFLRSALEKRRVLKPGDRVVVVGGGDVAVDVAMTALRTGAGAVSLVTLEQPHELPARPWALAEAQANGIAFEYGWGVERFVEVDGKLGINLRRCTAVFDRNGRFDPVYENETHRRIEADAVIVAIGQQTNPDFLSQGGIATSAGRILVDATTRQTNHPRVFAGGDLVPGPNSVVHAMADGRSAAESILRLLDGEDLTFGRAYSGPVLRDFRVDTSRVVHRSRVQLLGRNGIQDFDCETEVEMTRDEAVGEAQRCLNCGQPVGRYRTCWMCLPCEIECPHDALHVEVPYLMR